MQASARPDRRPRAFGTLTLLAAAFLSASLCFETPITIYLSNRAFFDARTMDLLLLAGVSTAALTLILILPARFPSLTWQRIYACTLSGLAISCWLHSSVFTIELGTLRGDQIDIAAAMPGPAVTAAGAAAALATIALAWVRPRLALRGLQVFLFAVLGATLVEMVQHASDPSDSENRSLADIDVYGVSRTANSFIIIFDAFQADVFEEIVNGDPSIQSALEGFTFFANTLGVAGSTTLAIPAILSGEQYRLGETIPHYMERGGVRGSFLSELTERGYDVAYVRFRPSCPKTVACFSAGSLQGSRWRRALGDYAFLVDLSAVRALPPPAKNLAFNDGTWLVSRVVNMPAALRGAHGIRDMAFFENFTRRIHPAHDRPTVRLLHLVFPHSPIVYDEHCQPYGRQQPWTRENFLKQSTCALRRFAAFRDRLRKLGIDDASLLVLVADHGAGFARDGSASTISDSAGRDLLAYGHPLFAVKPPGAVGRMARNVAPVHLADLRSTVCSFLDGCTGSEAPSAFDVAVDAVRERRIDGSFLWTKAYWDGDYPKPFTSYVVRGPVEDASGWYPVHGRFPTDHLAFDKDDEQAQSAYGIGWKKGFHTEGESSARWAVGKRAVLYFRLRPGRPARLRFRVKNWHDGQTMTLTVNGTLIGTAPVPTGDYTEISFDVPATAIDRELSTITIDCADDGTGKDNWLGAGRLAVLFDEVTVDATDGRN